MMTPEQFARNEYRDYVVYRELAKTEPVAEFKKILEKLVHHEWDDYQFWLKSSTVKTHRVSVVHIWALRLMRRLLGLTFTAKFLELHEKEAVRNYAALIAQADAALRPKLEEIVAHEMHHERELIGQIHEERVKFLGSVVLGINDGLIELTGALVGFAFALQQQVQVGVFGVVTGMAATLSMTASAYMQARHEEGRDPKKAALYTGGAYGVVVALLVAPFFLFPSVTLALAAMVVMIVALIAGFSFYSAVLFERDYQRQFREMLLFSLGVAVVAFLLGSVARRFLVP